MRIGFCLPHDGELSKPDNLAELSLHAEKLGFDTLVLPSDHIAMPDEIMTEYPYSASGEYTDTREDMDPPAALSFIAAKTERIRLMTGIMVIPYRNPLATASALATVDYLSKGRLDVGAGVGWMKEEFDLLRVPFRERGEMTDEYLRILKEVWSAKRPSFNGKYYRFSGVHFSPKVVQKPHPPIWIGGESPRAIKRAAELGDGWFPIGDNTNSPLSDASQLAEAIASLKQQVRNANRNPGDVQMGYLVQNLEFVDGPMTATKGKRPFVGSSRKILADIKEFEGLGVSFIAASFLRGSLDKTKAHTERFAREILSKL